MKISYCTTCKGRAAHLKQTLPQNISDALADAGEQADTVEFVVLNYSSTDDDMHEWMMSDPDMLRFMDIGSLNYYKHDGKEEFHHAHAKNMAHRLADGDILCNVDADNFIGLGFHGYLSERFAEDMAKIIYPGCVDYADLPPEERGFVGRIAIARDNFYMLGGYNENIGKGWGGEDTEFVARAVTAMLDVEFCHNENFLQVISHSHDERTKYAGKEAKEKATTHFEMTEGAVASVSGIFNRLSYLAGPAQANKHGHFGMGEVSEGKDQIQSSLIPANDLMSDCRVHIRGIAKLISTHSGKKTKLNL